MSSPDEEPVLATLVEAERPDDQPWGLWATAGFGLFIAGVFILLQTVVAGLFVAVAMSLDPRANVQVLAERLQTNGLLLATATCVTAAICPVVIVLLIKLRRGMPLRRYLGLRPVAPRECVKWIAAAAALVVASDFVTYLLDKPIVPEFMTETYRTAAFVPLLWLALIVGAPLFEETLFRGFLFSGFRYSRPGPVGAILITALAWALMHFHYDFYAIFIIFLGGILLGFARLKTESIYPPLAMHAAWNLIATIETAMS